MARLFHVVCYALPLLAFTAAPLVAAELDPPDITAYTVTDSSVTVSFNASPALRGKTTYIVRYCVATSGDACQPDLFGANGKSIQRTVTGLDAASVHYFQVSAYDTGGNEGIGGVFGPVTTCATGIVCDAATCDYPIFRTSNLDENKTPFVKPDWASQTERVVFDDDFASGANSESWIIGDMYDPISQSGNSGIDEFGAPCANCKPKGKRWSAWYDEHWAVTIDGYSSELAHGDASGLYRVTGLGGGDGVLALGGHVQAGANDPTRPGAGPPWSNNRLYSSWLKTWARDPVFRDMASGQNVAGRSKWTAPMYLEARVNFEQMTTPGFRVSLWMMPATYLEDEDSLATGSEAFDGNFNNGMEIDIFEYEALTPECKALMEFSWINSFATRGKLAKIATGKAHLNASDGHYPSPASGWHTVGLLWTASTLQWVYDGFVVLEINDAEKIPDIYQYVILSREMVNGRITGDAIYDGDGYFLPPEGGLYGYFGASNIGDHIDRINGDKAQIDYVRIYKPAP